MPCEPRRLAIRAAAACLSALIGCVRSPTPPKWTSEGVPPVPERLRSRIDACREARAASFKAWDPDGSGLFLSAYRQGMLRTFHLEAPGGEPKPSFGGIEGDLVVCPTPGSRSALLLIDEGGDERYQIQRVALDGGKPALLSDGTSRHDDPRWTWKGDRILCSSTARNGKDMDVRILDPARPGPSRLLTEGAGHWFVKDVSRDDARCAVQRFVSAGEASLYTVALSGGDPVLVAPLSGRKAWCGNARFSADGRTLYYITNEWGETRSIARVDLASMKAEPLAPDQGWDVDFLEVSPDGERIAYTTNEEGISILRLLELRSGASHAVGGLPVGVIGGLSFSPDGKRLGLTLGSASSPGDVYVVELPSGRVVRWTGGASGEAEPPGPVLIRYPTFDLVEGRPRTIPAFYHRPRGAEGKVPVVIGIHGGPEWQERPGFNRTIRFLVDELGCAVLVPNVRGSTGYGKAYLDLDNGMRREDAVKDVGALLDWIALQPDLDAGRVAVMGGSYGGYMALATMARFGDRLRCGASTVGISHFVTFLENTAEYRRDARRVEYGDERDPEMRAFLERISPTTLAGSIRKPLLVVHGANDPRVPVAEAHQIARAVRANGVPVELLVFRKEGHGNPVIGFGRFEDPESDLEYGAVLMHFLSTHLLR